MSALSFRHFLFCYLGLMLLLALTVFLNQFHLGPWSIILGLGIAALKAILILMIFMQASLDKNYWLLILGLLIFLSAVALLTLSDYTTRLEL
jgi:caa(3)-type oxidase subunit IV